MGMYNKLPCWSSILGYSWANLRKLKINMNSNITITKNKNKTNKKPPKNQRTKMRFSSMRIQFFMFNRILVCYKEI